MRKDEIDVSELTAEPPAATELLSRYEREGWRVRRIQLVAVEGATPMPGVTVVAAGTAEPANDFYFSDDDPLMRRTIDPAQTATGVSGSALFINGSLQNMTGSGGEPAGCSWPPSLGASVPGAVMFQIRRPDCP